MCLSPFFCYSLSYVFSPLYYNTAYHTVSNTIDSNELTGSIPIEIGLLTSLRDLLLCKLLNESRIIFVYFYFILNYLFVFPHYSSLNCCSWFTIIYSDQNYFTGSVPSEVLKMPNYDPYFVGEFMLSTPFCFSSWCITFMFTVQQQ